MIKKAKIPLLRGRGGFTLIEVLIVVSIIALLSGIGFGALDYLANRRADQAASQIYSDMQYAKVKAVYENRFYQVIFGTPASNQYTIQFCNAVNWTGGACGVPWTPAATPPNGVGTLPSGIVYGSNALVGVPLSPTGNEALPPGGVSFPGNTLTFQPCGQAGVVNGTVYLVPSKDINSTRQDRNRAVMVQYPITGKIQAYRFDGKQWNNF
jgi:prepilin-type N-terminal cleavage/methylation domain-containing protein